MTSDSTTSIRQALSVAPGPVNLAGYPTDTCPLAPVTRNRELRTDAAAMADLQEQLWAESTAGGRRSILLVLQGMDTAGKGGISKHVVGTLGPIGVQYTAFKKPTAQELKHDFLWRIRKRLPTPGVIGVFDRSHYEDVLVARVHDLVPPAQWEQRYDLINDFEGELAEAGTTVVKCFVHISYDTQRDRLLRRLDRPDKHWKFNAGDLDERARWADYQVAYEAVLERTNAEQAPWYVVPGDHKKYRNWAVGQILHETLVELDPHYPQPDLDIAALRRRLTPPH